jgi:hypothetical protein
MPVKVTAAFATDAVVARAVCVPAVSPSVQRAAARPSASVVTVVGLTAPDGSDADQRTETPDTPRPNGSRTRTTSESRAEAGPFDTICPSPDTSTIVLGWESSGAAPSSLLHAADVRSRTRLRRQRLDIEILKMEQGNQLERWSQSERVTIQNSHATR